MSQVIEKVFSSHDNAISLVLSEDGVPLADHSSITRAIFTIGLEGIFADNYIDSFDSSVNPEYFDLTQTDSLIIKLGQATVPKGQHWCELTIFTDQAPNGIRWQPAIEVAFR